MNIVMVLAAVLVAGEHSSSCRFDWLPTGMGMPGTDGEAYCSTVWDPDGPGPQEELLVVGGYFRIADNVAAGSIAAWDGERWHALGEGSIGRVTALTVYNGDLLAASRHSEEPDVRRWTGATWEPMDFGLLGAQIDAFTTYQGELVAGGVLTVEGAEPSANIARWDGVKWRPLGLGTTQDSVTGRVHALAVYKGDLVAGGEITSAGGNPVKRIARWDGLQWHDMAGGVEGRFNPGYAPVNALLATHDELIVGGSFDRAGGLQASGIARWNGEAWNPLGSLEWIESLTLYRGEIIAAGYRIHRWDGQAWTELGLGLSPGEYARSSCLPTLTDPEIRSLTVFRDELVAAGASKFAGGKAARYVASWDGENWNSLGSGFSVPPYSLLSHEGKLIAADGFRTLKENSGRSFISSWDGHAWEALGDAVDGEFLKLASYRGDIVLGGNFWIPAEPSFIQHIARWDGSQWQSLGGSLGYSPSCRGVTTIVQFRDELIVGGSFVGAGDAEIWNLAAWDGDAWHALGNGSPSPWAMTLHKDALIVGGGFLSIGGVPARNIATWDGAAWQPLADGLDGTVIALTTWGDDLVALYWWDGRHEHTRGARWNGESWVPMGTTRGNTVTYMMAYNGELFAFGDFAAETFGPIHGAIKWNGVDWELVPDIGFPGAWSVTIHEGNMIVGGSIALPDGTATPNLSIWGPTHARGDYDGDRVVDLTDLSRLPECMTGPSNLNLRLATSDCLCVFNSEGDGDIDLMDVGALQNKFTRK